MKKSLLLLVFLIRCAFSSEIDPFQQANLTSEPSAYVEGCVNAITGDYVMQEHSLIVQGIEPITMNLSYVSSSPKALFSGWSFQQNVSLIFHSKSGSFSCAEKNGVRLDFNILDKIHCCKELKKHPKRESSKDKDKRHEKNLRKIKKKDKYFETILDEEVYKKGLCQCPYYDFSGRINLRNTHAVFHPVLKECKITTASGAVRFYSIAKRQRKDVSLKNPDCFDDADFLPLLDEDEFYLLRYENLPNGNQLHYAYDDYNHLIEIRSTNGDGSKTYAWVKFCYLKKSSQSRDCEISTSDGKKIVLLTKVRNNDGKSHKDDPFLIKNRISSLKWPGRPLEKFDYHKNRVISREKSSNCLYHINYYSRKKNNDLGFKKIRIHGKHNPRISRVRSLSAPVGDNGEYFDTSRFIYHPDFDDHGRAFTEVWDVNDSVTQYKFKNDLRLYEVSCFQNNKSLFCCKKKVTFGWGKEGSDEVTFLLAKTLWDGNIPKLSTRYYYDKMGNVVQEKIIGNLSGESQNLLSIDENNLPKENSAESFAKRRKFSEEGKNLLIEENDDSGICTKISYLGNTDLIESKLILFQGQIKIRNFYEYNSENILIRMITDDGTHADKKDLEGVSERKILVITPKREAPFLAMPEIIEEYYLDLGTFEEKLLQRKVIHYSSKGYIEKEDIYDANGQYRYSCSITYDEEGRPTSKTNPLGETQIIQYDENFLPSYNQSFGKRLEESKRYDIVGRLIETIKRGKDSTARYETYKYDQKSNLVYSKNYLGHETKFSYSTFGELTEEIGPKVVNEHNQSYSPIKRMSYDGLGRKITVQDPRGNLTKFSYNAYNDPILIEYPDGSTERSIFNLNGTLKIHIDQLGTETHYTYDFLKRVISKKIFSKEGELLAEEKSTYNAFHELSKTDANGITTFYFYDGAGRKVREERAESVKEIEYDPLGREYKEIFPLDFGKIIKIKEKDFLDRVIEERVENEKGKVQFLEQFTYDAGGNKSSIRKFIGNQECLFEYKYDAFDRLIKKVDSLGKATIVTFSEDNPHGTKEINLEKRTMDPLGRKTVETIDARGKTILVEKLSKKDTLLSHEEFSHDETGNVKRELRWVISNGAKLSEQLNVFEYDLMNRKITQIEAADSFAPKITRYDYDKMGHMVLQKNPNGLDLSYEFDPLGKNIHLSSSDGKCSYVYSYDRLGNLLESCDQITSQRTQREYDTEGNLTSENLANGLWLQSTFDPIGRKTKMVLPDDSSVIYGYEGNNLAWISRQAAGGEEQYSHQFTCYDLSGNCLEEEMIGGLGILKKTFSPIGQTSSLSSPYCYQKVTQFDAVGKILNLKTSSSLHQEEVAYTYDDLDHLTSEYGSLFPHDFSCDSLHNRLSKDAASYLHNELNELISTQEREYCYDLNGNPISIKTHDKTVLLEYDSLDRLISLTIPNEKRVVFNYDSFHRRISKENDLWLNNRWEQQSIKRFLYDDEKEIAEVSEDGSFDSFRVLNPEDESEIDSAVAIELSGIVYAPLHDIGGSVLGLVSADTKKLCVHYCYSAFGEMIKKSDSESQTNFFENPWNYCSKRFDEDLGMYFFGRRFYDPEVGSWLTPDPEGLTDGPNLYAYVRHCPVIFIDHYGLWCETINLTVSLEYNDGKNTVSLPFDLGNKSISEQLTPYERERINRCREIWANPCSIGVVEGRVFPHKMIVFMNGIGNELPDCESNARLVSAYGGGVQVLYIHNATNGRILDLREAKRNFYEREQTEPGIIMAKIVKTYLLQDPKNEVLLILHSQATLFGRNYLGREDEKFSKRVSLCAVAPAAYTPSRNCKEVTHLVSDGDLVTHMAFLGRILHRKTIVHIPAVSKHFVENHTFNNPAYKPLITYIIENFINQSEEYQK